MKNRIIHSLVGSRARQCYRKREVSVTHTESGDQLRMQRFPLQRYDAVLGGAGGRPRSCDPTRCSITGAGRAM